MKTAVITGASKGLGASIAKLFMNQATNIIGISRTENEQLKEYASKNHVQFTELLCDLSNSVQVQQVFSELGEKLFNENKGDVFLINNAAMVDPIEIAGNYSSDALTKHIAVNLTAPMITTNIFLEKATKANTPLVIVNVTSGAAERSVSGWSAYCSTKAGLNRFTETVALEQADKQTVNKVILFDPSIMDTNMQGQIRSSSTTAFKDVATFQEYKQTNQLRDTDIVAAALVEQLLEPTTIISGKNYSIKELLT